MAAIGELYITINCPLASQRLKRRQGSFDPTPERKIFRACLKIGRGPAAGEFWVGQAGERRGRPLAVCSARTNAVQAGKTRRRGWEERARWRRCLSVTDRCGSGRRSLTSEGQIARPRSYLQQDQLQQLIGFSRCDAVGRPWMAWKIPSQDETRARRDPIGGPSRENPLHLGSTHTQLKRMSRRRWPTDCC
jgi:hypothetical protein